MMRAEVVMLRLLVWIMHIKQLIFIINRIFNTGSEGKKHIDIGMISTHKEGEKVRGEVCTHIKLADQISGR